MKSRKHAADVAKALDSPEYQEILREREREMADHVRAYRAAERPILEDLRSHGYDCDTLDNLLGYYPSPPLPIIEILLAWIPRVDNQSLKQSMIDPFAYAKAPFDGQPLVDAFVKEDSSESFRWSIANAFAMAKPAGIGDWLVKAIKNPKYGKPREMLAIALAKNVAADQALPVLRAVLDEFPGHVASALRRIGGQTELDALKARLPEVSKARVRKEFEKTIKAIERRLSKPKKTPRKRRPEA